VKKKVRLGKKIDLVKKNKNQIDACAHKKNHTPRHKKKTLKFFKRDLTIF